MFYIILYFWLLMIHCAAHYVIYYELSEQSSEALQFHFKLTQSKVQK